ncbi:hypothetical protein [Taibaiella koreensis]|uniref:hypothetical protein n=1 Tax=Taibaiella koreensis TaxID=1268548 RepID=UPI0013C2A855|nr:hypothetical protein [Taibaiella koreensis]
MKTIFFKSSLGTMLLLTAAGIFSSCNKKSDAAPAPPAEKQHWVKVYKDVMLGDQENHGIGHFLKTQNGQVVAVGEAQTQQEFLSMMYYTQYGANYVVFTFPGNGRSASAYTDIETNRLFVQNPGGIDHWAQANLNTGEIDRAYRNGTYMSLSEFEALASSRSWSDFNSRFVYFNGGETDLSAGSFVVPGNGEIYMIQLNNTVRGFIRVKSVVPSSGNGGSIKFDMVIEGGDDYTTSSEAKNIQPGKD